MKTLVILLSLLVVGGASASTILLANRGGTDGKGVAAPAAASASTSPQASNPHPLAGSFKPDKTDLASCRDQRCYEQAFGNLAYQRGPKRAMAVFDEKIRTNRAIEAGCHRIAHMIGSAALARYHGNVGKAFSEGSASCWSGYYHGILSYAFADVRSDAGLTRKARSVCSDPEIHRTTYLAYQCVHGLGHGLMLTTAYDLPGSLAICHRLATSWDQTSCTGGVFMENITPSLGGRTKWLKANNLVYPCNVVKERDKLYCYLMVTSRILQANGYNWKATARMCSRVEASWVETCFQSYGRDASGSTRQDPPRVLQLCSIAKSYADECIYGAARDMTSNYANGERASQLCGGAPKAIKHRCFNGIGTILGNLEPTSEGRQKACRSVTTAYLADCLRGSGEPA